MELVAFIGEFKGEEGCFFVEESKENLVAFPHGEFEQVFFLNPFEVTFVAHDFVAGPFGTHEEVHVFVFPSVGDEGDDAAVAPLGDGESGLFPHFAQHTVLWAFPFLEVTSYAEPFVVVKIVFFFGAVEHEVLGASFQVAESGLFQL